MFLKISTAAAALIAATAIAGAASAQSQSGFVGDSANPTGAVQTDPNAAPAVSNGASASAAVAADSSGYNVGTPQTDPNTGAQIVTNGPVPDTRANRARFGTPDSHAGKRTSAAGN